MIPEKLPNPPNLFLQALLRSWTWVYWEAHTRTGCTGTCTASKPMLKSILKSLNRILFCNIVKSTTWKSVKLFRLLQVITRNYVANLIPLILMLLLYNLIVTSWIHRYFIWILFLILKNASEDLFLVILIA